MSNTNWARQAVAAGNGLDVSELPRFRHHVHTETHGEIHRSWAECADSWCTWAGHTPGSADRHCKGGDIWDELTAR